MASRWALVGLNSAGKETFSPPGFDRLDSHSGNERKGKGLSREQAKQVVAIKGKKAWQIATSPLGGIFMNGFMMWLSGSSVHIFSMSITFYFLFSTITALFSVSKYFKRFEDPALSLLQHKLTFIAIQFLALFVIYYKVNSLGILPSVADWYPSIPVKMAQEISGSVLLQ